MAAAAVEKRFGALGRMGIVAGMHVALLVVVANSLGLVPSIVPTEPMITTIDHEQPIDDPVPKIPFQEDLTQKDVFVPEPEHPTTEADDSGSITAKLVRPDEIPIGEPPREAVRETLVAVRQDPAHPLTQPAYPAPMIRNNTEGVVEVEVFVQPDGRVSDARIVKSSGFDAFDRATLEEAKRRWRLMPATRDGVPYPQWARQRVVFKLVNR